MFFYRSVFFATAYCLMGFASEGVVAPVVTTDTFYNSTGGEAGRVTVTQSNEVGERDSYSYKGDQGSLKGDVSTSYYTGSPVETFYDPKGRSVGTSSMVEDDQGVSTKTFFDSKGRELGNVSPDRGREVGEK